MTALAKTQPSNALARPHSTSYFSPEQIATLKNVICPGLTDSELDLVGEVARQTGLSPFLKQLHVTKRPTWDPDARTRIPKLTIQTGIDGYRLTAERTGKYLGQRGPEWCGPDGVWRDVWLSKQPPAAARVFVLKAGCEPFPGLARYDAYVQTTKEGGPNSMWQKMGAEQLAKCAEALALRKAFPMELAGTYTSEEMAQADNPEPVRAEVIERPLAPSPSVLSAGASSTTHGGTAGRGTSATAGTSSTGTATSPTSGSLPARTSKNYAVKQWADKPFAALPDGELGDYLAYYSAKRNSSEFGMLHAAHQAALVATIAAGEAELQFRLETEGQPLTEDVSDTVSDTPDTDFDPETGEVLETMQQFNANQDGLEEKLRASVEAQEAKMAAAVEMAQAGIEWGNTNESLGLVGADAPANQSGKRSRKGAA
jgi:phage recombination protein Bet